jgi:hypothetical protein
MVNLAKRRDGLKMQFRSWVKNYAIEGEKNAGNKMGVFKYDLAVRGPLNN